MDAGKLISPEERLQSRWPEARIVDKLGKQVWRPGVGSYTYTADAPDRFEVVEGVLAGTIFGEGPTAEAAVEAALRYDGPIISL